MWCPPPCSRENRDDARFCDRCGRALVRGSEEIRPGTVLKCDVVGSTSITRRLVRDNKDESAFYTAFRDVVHRTALEHGGTVYKVEGDGASIVFDYPMMREDAEVAAISAGLALVVAVQSLTRIAGVPVRLRVGVASGMVKANPAAGQSRTDEELVGQPWNFAERLQNKAPRTGGVVIADDMRLRTGRFFRYRSLGRVRLAGIGLVQVSLVLAKTAVASRFVALRSGRSVAPLLGRRDVVSRLLRAWNRASKGRGAVVVLEGEAGIGKSRLARTICDHAQHRGARRLEFDCTESAMLTPLHPVSAVLRRVAGSAGRGEVARAHRDRLASMLEELLGRDSASAAANYLAPLIGLEVNAKNEEESAERIRERVIESLVEVTMALAARAPLVLLFEDVQWADPTTKYLLRKLSEVASLSRTLIIATTRPVGAEDALDLGDKDEIHVEPLDDTSARELVRRTPGGRSLAESRVDRIVKTAERNPLLLEEFTRAAVEQPDVVPEAGVDELHRAITARLDRHPELKPVVQAASVLGREFSARLLGEMLGGTGVEVSSAIRSLADLGLLTDLGQPDPERVRFKHQLICDGVYTKIVRDEKLRLHSVAADLLQRGGESAPDLLAHHFAGAGRFEEAVRALVAASDSAARRAAYAEAEGHCRKGLDLAASVEDVGVARELKLELLTRLGVALSARIGYAHDDVEKTYQQARGLCGQGVAATALFPVVRGLGTFYFVRCKLLNAAEMSKLCLDLAEQSGRPDFLIEALSFRGYTCVFRGDFAEGRAALEECLRLYARHGGEQFRYPSAQDAGTAAWSLLGIAAWLLGDVAGADAAVAGALAHSERLGRKFDTAYVHVWIAMLRNMQRRFEEASTHAQLCVELANQHGFATWLYAAMMHDYIAKASLAPSPKEVASLRGWLNAFINSGAEANASFFLWGIARGLRSIGETGEAKKTVQDALRRAKASGESYFMNELLILAAELEEKDARARALLSDALALAERQGATTLALRAALELLKRKGTFSPEAQLAWEAVEGKAPYPSAPDWPAAALSVVRTAVTSSGPSTRV